jgi:hypothetical protein
MDLIFDEEVDEVGSDIEAYCPKCRGDTTHVVISKYEEEIRKVQCNPCGDVHSYRKPRGDGDEEPLEPLAVKRRAQIKKPTFEEYMAQARTNTPRPYGFRETYSQGDVVNHPKFGLGYVSELLSDDKLEVTFKDGRRILVHNRRDLPEPPSFTETRKPEQTPSPRESSRARKAARPEPVSRVSTGARRRKPKSPRSQRAPARPPVKPQRRPTKTPAATRRSSKTSKTKKRRS